MKLVEVTALALRIFGLYFFMRLSNDIANGLIASQHGFSSAAQLGKSTIYSTYFIPLGFSIFLVFFPMTIAKLITPKTPDESPALEGNGKSIQIAAFTIIGIYILSWAIPELIGNALTYWITSYDVDIMDFKDQRFHDFIVYEIVTIIQISVGVYLIFGAKGILGFIEKFRNWGLQE